MKLSVRQSAAVALMAAVICVLSPLSIPLASQVPISLATLAVMLAGALLGSKAGTLAVLIYIILGMIGLPVFAGWTSGAAIVFGMTGCYIIGYLPLAFCTGYFFESHPTPGALVLGMVIGTITLYTIGTVWFMLYTKTDLTASLTACVLPFLPGDVLKMILTALVTPRIRPAARKLMHN
jgi:biotin transport system substrate-specific component